MTEETYVQLFWAIALPTVFGLVLIIGGAIHYLMTAPDYRRFLRMQRAKKTWARMLSGDSNDRDRAT